MPQIRILSETDLRACVSLDSTAVECVENCFRALATKDVVMPPIMRLDIHEHNGEADVKTAYVPGLESFAIKISPGFFDNPKLGLPSTNGLMVLFSAKTGLVEAVLLDNGYLTDVRTAAAGAVAAKHLSRKDAMRAGVFGSGMQARLQMAALKLVRPIEFVQVWARDAQKAKDLATQLASDLKIEARATEDREAVVRESDIVVTTTPSREPLLEAGWLHPGLHVTAMGSDAEHKNEIAPNALVQADLYVCDRQSQCQVLGELHHAIEAGLIAADAVQTELGQVIAGQASGRSSADQVTLCDLTGTGVQDTAIATLARQRAEAAGSGTIFES
jgi:ornithine cyclodeaminase